MMNGVFFLCKLLGGDAFLYAGFPEKVPHCMKLFYIFCNGLVDGLHGFSLNGTMLHQLMAGLE